MRLVWAAAPSPGPAAQTPQAIHFAPGASSAVVRGATVRGERALYSINAGAGQHLSVTIKSLEKNAVFQLYAPRSRNEQAATGTHTVGETLAGADEGDDATRWNGVLKVSGLYVIVVGSTRGNASYRLSVRLR